MRVVLARDDVRGRDDEVARARTSRCPRRRPRTRCRAILHDRALRRGARRARARSPGSAARRRAAGPAIDGNGSMRASRCSSRRGGTALVEPADDLGALHLAAAASSGPGRAAPSRRAPRRATSPVARAEDEPPAESRSRSGVSFRPPRMNEPTIDGDASGAAVAPASAPTSPASGVQRRARAAAQQVRRERASRRRRRRRARRARARSPMSPRRQPAERGERRRPRARSSRRSPRGAVSQHRRRERRGYNAASRGRSSAG